MNLVMLGPPGSGKGTQAVRLAERLGIEHLSTGEILREAVRDQTELGRKAEGYMKNGDLVPDDLIVSLIEEKVDNGELSGGFVLDGFPRTIPQAEALRAMLSRHQMKIDRAVLLKVNDDEIMTRLLKRAEIEGRNDDNEEVIQNRLEVYRKQTAPIVDFYRKASVLREVDGVGAPDNVMAEIEKVTQS